MKQFKPGTIIMMDFSPTKGHEQAGRRPALIINNKDYGRLMQLSIVCPITNTDNHFPIHVPLDSRTVTTGCILCEHIRTVDLTKRKASYIEDVPSDIYEEVRDIVTSFFE